MVGLVLCTVAGASPVIQDSAALRCLVTQVGRTDAAKQAVFEAGLRAFADAIHRCNYLRDA